MKILSNAKVNLNLMINGITAGGYHLLYSVVAPISLCDEIEIKVNKTGKINIVCDDKNTPTNNNNIISKCIEKMRTIFNFVEGFDIVLKKNIPLEAGLGGGSSNGASVMVAINELLNLRQNKEELARIGATIGADIPFFIYNKMAVIEGSGDIITPFESENFKPFVLLVKPYKGISTKEAFRLYDSLPRTKEITLPILHELIKENKIDEINCYLKNDLERAAVKLVPEIEEILNTFRKDNILAFMSGSGSCCVGLFFEEDKAIEYSKKFENRDVFVKITKII